MNQCEAWLAAGVQVVTRPLRYPASWPHDPAQEKGVDIALAIDFVTMAIHQEYDIGVIMSTDTDLLPALEFVNGRPEVPQVAVAAWGNVGRRRYRLTLSDSNIWCHWLDRDDYDAAADLTNYAR